MLFAGAGKGRYTSRWLIQGQKCPLPLFCAMVWRQRILKSAIFKAAELQLFD
jgi:hypothetical protein